MNPYARLSRLQLTTEVRGEKTIVTDRYFTAPFKVLPPFASGDGIQIMVLSVSAGMMEGDEQQLDFTIGEGSRVEITSQAYEKIHKMQSGCARRCINIRVERDAVLRYLPLPVIPFAQSAFQGELCVELAEGAQFIYCEILSAGRTARGEAFEYRSYRNEILVRRAGRPVYLDRLYLNPQEMELDKAGFFEGYTHLANLLLFRDVSRTQQTEIREFLHEQSDVEGDITRLTDGSCAVRIFGRQSQRLLALCKTIGDFIEK